MVQHRPLTERMKIAAQYLANGHPTRIIANKLQCGERLIYKWKYRDDFQAYVRKCQAETLQTSTRENITIVPEAIEVLKNIMNDEEQRASDRIAAARSIIAGAENHNERNALENQISHLERQLFNVVGVELPSSDDEMIDVTPESDE